MRNILWVFAFVFVTTPAIATVFNVRDGQTAIIEFEVPTPNSPFAQGVLADTNVFKFEIPVLLPMEGRVFPFNSADDDVRIELLNGGKVLAVKDTIFASATFVAPGTQYLTGFPANVLPVEAEFSAFRDASINARIKLRTDTPGSGYVLDTQYIRASLGEAKSNNTAFLFNPLQPVVTDVDVIGSPRLSKDMFLASVGSASIPKKSTGTALADSIEYFGTDGSKTYAEQKKAAQDCALYGTPPGCNINDLEAEAEQGFAQFARDVGQVGVAVNTEATSIAIGSASVDNDTFTDSLLGKVVKVGELISKGVSLVTNAIDFRKEITDDDDAPAEPQSLSTPSLRGAPAALTLSTQNFLDPVVVESITGTTYWDDDGFPSWLIADLLLETSVSSEYFDEFRLGETFATQLGLYPGSTSFGVFTVENLSKVNERNRVMFSFRNVDLLSPEAALVPAPAPIVLMMFIAVYLMVTAVRKSTVLEANTNLEIRLT